MKLRPLLLIPLSLLALPALAKVEAACQPVVAASESKIAAPSFHDRKQFGGMTLELIKIGENLYSNRGDGWTQMSTSASHTLGDFRTSLDKGEISLSQCKQLGRETVAGHDTRIYQFTTTVHGISGTGKVWIGDDGLPYREASDSQDGTTVYTGITAPDVKPLRKKK